MKIRGFSLLELLVVIGLITALSAIAAPKVITLFKGRAIAQAYNTIDGSFQEARSKAISTRRDTAVYIAYRSSASMPVAKVWVVDGGEADLDTTGPLAGLMIDERDNGLGYDDAILSEQEISPTVYVHGLCTGASYSSGVAGYFTRWYGVFRPDGTCMMVMPDGDAGTEGSTSGSWKDVNDYLPVPYDAGSGASAPDVDVSMQKVLPDDFESDWDRNYDLKLRDDEDEIFVNLQPSTGKLVKRSSIDSK